MRLSTSIRIAVVLTAVSSALVLGLLLVLERSLDEERRLTRRQIACRSLGRELAAASDFLTSQARRYAISGDRKYHDAYWEEVNQTRTRDKVVEQLRAYDMVPGELDLIDEAKRLSDELIVTERQSMQAVGDGNSDLAQRLLFNEYYDGTKSRINEAIDQFQVTMNTRIDAEAHKAESHVRQARKLVSTVVLTYVVLVFLGLYVSFYRNLIIPLLAITNAMSRISAGELDFQIPTPGTKNELSDLAVVAMHFRDSIRENVRLARNLQIHRDHLQREVNEQSEMLRRTDERVRRTFHASPDGLVIESDSRGIVSVNAQFGKMFGYAKDSLVGLRIENLLAEECREGFMAFRAACQAAGAQPQPKQRFLAVRDDGTEFPVEIGFVKIDESEDVSECMMMVIVIDFSERGEKPDHGASTRRFSLKLKDEQLGRLNTELLDFAYNVSHDLKGPLLSMAGLLDFCKIDLEAGEYDEAGCNIVRIQRLAKRLANRVESMLALARTDLKSDLWETIDATGRIQEAWESLPSDGMTFQTQLQDADSVLTVAARFDTVVENLLSNAIKYHDPSRSDRIVQVSSRMEGDSFVLSVADNGLGIPEEQREKVFRMFHRLAGTAAEGTGLGLALVKRNVLHLGGEISLEDNAEGMTTFTVTLPQAVVAESEHEVAKETSRMVEWESAAEETLVVQGQA